MVAVHNGQMTIHWDLSPAERYAYSAAEWAHTHWRDFVRLKAYLHRQVDAGDPRTTRSDVLAWAKQEGVGMSDVATVVRNHNLWAGLARYMVMMSPRLCRTVHFKRSEMDDLDLVAIWHEVAKPDTHFFARDVEEARRLVEIGDASAQ